MNQRGGLCIENYVCIGLGGDGIGDTRWLLKNIKYMADDIQIIKTHDGVEICYGDVFWALENWEPKTYMAHLFHFGAAPTFSTLDSAKEYILLNKPSICINDLISPNADDCVAVDGFTKGDLKEIVKKKMNAL